jgi:hypothetical protein
MWVQRLVHIVEVNIARVHMVVQLYQIQHSEPDNIASEARAMSLRRISLARLLRRFMILPHHIRTIHLLLFWHYHNHSRSSRSSNRIISIPAQRRLFRQGHHLLAPVPSPGLFTNQSHSSTARQFPESRNSPGATSNAPYNDVIVVYAHLLRYVDSSYTLHDHLNHHIVEKEPME